MQTGMLAGSLFGIAILHCDAHLSCTVHFPEEQKMTTPTKLFDTFKLGSLTLPNRFVMAPLTRNRAVAGLVPNPLAVEYYAQRATAGLLITEASQVSQQGQGYQDTPGIYSREQIAGWRKVTDAVHARGGRIFLQAWHVGRISHTSLQPNGGAPVAPSAIRAKGKTFVNNTFADVSEPRALALDEIPGIIESFRRGAANAIEAGFDGVEVQGANGYLLDQFAKDGTNKRTDAYGGSIENRARLMLEVTKVVAAEIGAERTGIRISPVTPANDISDKQSAAAVRLYRRSPQRPEARLYPRHRGRHRRPARHCAVRLRLAAQALQAGLHRQQRLRLRACHQGARRQRGRPDRVRKTLHRQPDLVERMKQGAALNVPDKATFYGGGAKGYTDYPRARRRSDGRGAVGLRTSPPWSFRDAPQGAGPE